MPNLFSAPASIDLLDEIARALIGGEDFAALGVGDSPLSEYVFFLPTQRARRYFRERLLFYNGGKTLIMPHLRVFTESSPEALGLWAKGENPLPPMPDLQRRFLLARAIHEFSSLSCSAAQNFRLAGELAHLLDEAEGEGVSLEELEGLEPSSFSENWQLSLSFLKIIIHEYPKVLQGYAMQDESRFRAEALDHQREAWERDKPETPIFAIGSTGSVPAVRRLLASIACLPKGGVFLHGLALESEISDASWAAIGDDHPQYMLKKLLEGMGLERKAVRAIFCENTPCPERTKLLHAALLPSAETKNWPMLTAALKGGAEKALSGFSLCETRNIHEEASLIALALRKVLEEKDKTAALITPDRDLARAVSACLEKWGIKIDDGGGKPFLQTALGMFLRLVLSLADEGFTPIALLSLLKHPFARLGRKRGDMLRLTRKLEKEYIRGEQLLRFADLCKVLSEKDTELFALCREMETLFMPLMKQRRAEHIHLPSLCTDLLEIAEKLAENEEGNCPLWGERGAREGGALLQNIIRFGGEMGGVPQAEASELIEVLFLSLAIRSQVNIHPRLHIWGTSEARLQYADFFILGGLNEGSWPQIAETGPFLSRPMRERMGLSSPEENIALSALDFLLACQKPEVLLTRSQKSGGKPVIASRWWLRIAGFVEAQGKGELLQPAEKWGEMVRLLHRAERRIIFEQPKPKPPVSARPKRLSVTNIEKLLTDPYSVYARYVLKLHKLKPLHEEMGAAEIGTFIHRVLEVFGKKYAQSPPENFVQDFMKIAEETARHQNPSILQYWRARLEAIADALEGVERQRRADGGQMFFEAKIETHISELNFTLSAKADRIEFHKDKGISCVDYKTGTPASKKDMREGNALQLSLAAAILLYADKPSLPIPENAFVKELAYWKISGERTPIEIKNTLSGEEASAAMVRAWEKLRELIASYQHKDKPYISHLEMKKTRYVGDYDHLARLAEWSVLASKEEGEK